MRLTIFISFIMVMLANNGFSQNEIYDLKWETNPQSSLFLRPDNISDHAYLFESDQESFKVYFWVEFEGIVDTLNDIYKFRIYEKNGIKYETNYYFVIRKDNGFIISLNDYKVRNATSSIITIKSNGKLCQLCAFNFPAKDNKYIPNISCNSSPNDKYMVVTALESNKYNPKVCPLTTGTDVCVKLERGINNIYPVVIKDESGQSNKGNYKLNVEKGINPSQKPVYPFVIKYYDLDTKRIYLLEQGCFLEKVQ